MRDFDAEPLDALPPAGQFVLAGREWTVRNVEDVPLGTMLRIYAASAGGDKGALVTQIGPFFASVLGEGDAEPFAQMLLDPASPLKMRRMRDVIEHVVELLLDRPTTPAETSSPTPRRTRARSAAGSSSPGTARKKPGGSTRARPRT